MTSNLPLDGRVVLITGASSGLGARFAEISAAAGAKVVVGARRVDRLEALVAKIKNDGGQAAATAMDVSDEGSVEAAFDFAEQTFGAVTSVVANAGINVEGRAIDLGVDEFDRLFATNVRGVFLTARSAARRLQILDRGAEGRIVLISSITARMQTSGTVPYSASKAAVTHMGRVLAREWARKGPNVTILAPGYIKSELAADWFESDTGKHHISTWPRKKLLEEDALDATLLYLLSGASAGVTGSEFVIDDGQSL